MKLNKVVVLLTVSAWMLAVASAHACGGSTEPQRVPHSQLDSGVPAMGMITAATPSHNVGVYVYDEVVGTATLIDSYYDPDAASWAFNEGYALQSDESFAGGSLDRNSRRRVASRIHR